MALTPARPSPRAAGLPAYLATPSRRSASTHVMQTRYRFTRHNQRTGRVSDFAMRMQARRHTPPNRVRFTADRQFASSCSPLRLAATQLLSATGPWLTLTRTYTVLTQRLHGRTFPAACCGEFDFLKFIFPSRYFISLIELRVTRTCSCRTCYDRISG